MKTKLGFNPLTGQFDLVTSELDADEVVNVPSGNLAATDVQGALNELQSDVDSRIPSSEKGAINGVATLDGAGKIPSSQLPSTVMEFKGTWDASTNTPTLTNGTGDAGDVYIVSVAGTVNFGAGNITFEVRDYVVYNGTTWEKSDASDAVTSVFGRQGVVTAASGDYTASQITNVPSGNLAAVEVQAALNELQSDIDTRATTTDLNNHINDTVDAHDASAISNVPSGNLAATDVQAALNELQSDVDTRAIGQVSSNTNEVVKFQGTDGKQLIGAGLTVAMPNVQPVNTNANLTISTLPVTSGTVGALTLEVGDAQGSSNAAALTIAGSDVSGDLSRTAGTTLVRAGDNLTTQGPGGNLTVRSGNSVFSSGSSSGSNLTVQTGTVTSTSAGSVFGGTLQIIPGQVTSTAAGATGALVQIAGGAATGVGTANGGEVSVSGGNGTLGVSGGGVGGNVTIAAGGISGGNGTIIGGAVSIAGGDVGSGSGSRTGGSVTIRPGNGSTAPGNVNIVNQDNSQTGLRVRGTDGTVLLADKTIPANPPAGFGALYPKSTGSLYYKNPAGREIELGETLNEQPQTNYLRTWAQALPAAGTISTVSSVGNVTNNTWYSTNAGATFTITQDSSTPLRGLASYVSGTNTDANPNGTTFFQLPRFQLELADRGKPVSISFDVDGVTDANQWDVVIVRYNNAGTYQELIPVAGNASNATVTPSAQLPTGRASFRGFFIPTSDDSFYAVRFRRLSGSTQIEFDTLYVGPQQQLSGAAVTDWQAYTPTVAWTNTTQTGRWRRVGDSIQLTVDLAFTGAPGGISGFIANSEFLPSGLTVDTTKLPNVTDSRLAVGTWGGLDNGVLGAYGGHVSFANGIGIELVYPTGTNSATSITSTQPITWGNLDNISFTVTLPIANWSSNVTMAERTVEEWCINTSTSTSGSDTSAFNYSVAGETIKAFSSVNADVVKRIRTQGVITGADSLRLEVSPGNEKWFDALSIFPYIDTGSNKYGMTWQNVANSTDVDILFGGDGAAAGSPWSAFTSWRWRFRKTAPNGLVGFPIGSSNIIHQDALFVLTSTTTLAANATNLRYICNSGSAFTINLPNTSNVIDGTIFRIKNIGTGIVTIDGNGSETIDGSTTIAINQYSAVDIVKYSTGWYII